MTGQENCMVNPFQKWMNNAFASNSIHASCCMSSCLSSYLSARKLHLLYHICCRINNSNNFATAKLSSLYFYIVFSWKSKLNIDDDIYFPYPVTVLFLSFLTVRHWKEARIWCAWDGVKVMAQFFHLASFAPWRSSFSPWSSDCARVNGSFIKINVEFSFSESLNLCLLYTSSHEGVTFYIEKFHPQRSDI